MIRTLSPESARPAGPIWSKFRQSWLFRSFLGAALILGVLVLWTYVEFGSVAIGLAYLQGERLIVHPVVLDLGHGDSGAVREFHLIATNRTKQPITFLGTQTTCGCMSTDEFPLVFQSGETRPLKVKLQMNCSNEGRFRAVLRYYTDSTEKPQIDVDIMGQSRDGDGCVIDWDKLTNQQVENRK